MDLPLNGRNVIGLARILPGVLGVNAPQQMSDARGGPEMNVNGGRSNMNLFTLNGGYFNNPSRNTGMNYPPPDAVQEVRHSDPQLRRRVWTQSRFSGELWFRRRARTQFHGSAWEFLRNDALNARNFFSSRVPALKQNQFGAAAGGPVIKDKMFIFGTYQGLRDRREAQTVQAFVPSAARASRRLHGVGRDADQPGRPDHGPAVHGCGRSALRGRESHCDRLHQPRRDEAS